ncbi:MAG: regulatory protein RecX [Candidatus Omnitrophota bacterium]
MLKNRNADTGDIRKALQYAFLLLKFRPRSVREMEFRLENKGFDPGTVREALTFLQNKKFLDDGAFARAWAQSRAARSYGLSRISRELSSKGIERGLAGRALERLREDGYSEEKAALELVSGRKRPLLRDTDALKRKRRLFAFLSRRGFSPDVVNRVLEKFSRGKTDKEYED